MWSTLRKLRARCTNDYFAPFLRRRVRCKKAAGHEGAHTYTTFDEAVVWR